MKLTFDTNCQHIMQTVDEKTSLMQFQNLKSVKYQKSYLNCVDSERNNIRKL